MRLSTEGDDGRVCGQPSPPTVMPSVLTGGAHGRQRIGHPKQKSALPDRTGRDLGPGSGHRSQRDSDWGLAPPRLPPSPLDLDGRGLSARPLTLLGLRFGGVSSPGCCFLSPLRKAAQQTRRLDGLDTASTHALSLPPGRPQGRLLVLPAYVHDASRPDTL